MKREIIIGEIPKSRSDAWRVSIRSHREGRLVTVSQIHRFAGGEIDVPGRGLTVRPDQVNALTVALRDAAALAITERATAELDWLEPTKGPR